MRLKRLSVSSLPLLWNGKFGFDSESGQGIDFKLNIQSCNALRSVGKASRQVASLEKTRKWGLSSWSGRRMAVTPRAYHSTSVAFSCQKNENGDVTKLGYITS